LVWGGKGSAWDIWWDFGPKGLKNLAETKVSGELNYEGVGSELGNFLLTLIFFHSQENFRGVLFQNSNQLGAIFKQNFPLEPKELPFNHFSSPKV